jgi:hypothetical protein
VQIVSSLQRLLGVQQRFNNRTDAYKQLLKLLKEQPAPRWRYGMLRKEGSLKDAWNKIPKEVIANPEDFLPSNNTPAGELAKACADLMQTRELELTLPRIPTKLPK